MEKRKGSVFLAQNVEGFARVRSDSCWLGGRVFGLRMGGVCEWFLWFPSNQLYQLRDNTQLATSSLCSIYFHWMHKGRSFYYTVSNL